MNASKDALNELSDKIKINPNELDTEFVAQPNDFYHAATGCAMAISLRDKSKNDLEVAEAELYLTFRREASEAAERLTETHLDSLVTGHEIRQEYFDRYLDAKQLADQWIALRDSFTQKGHALRELAELYKLNYFGERSINAEAIRNRAYLDNEPH